MLRILGLTSDDQARYEELASRPPATAAELAELGVSQDTIGRLTDLGLVTLARTDPPRYVVVPPDTALADLARTRDRELARARQHMIGLAVRFHSGPAAAAPAELVEIVTGEAAIKRAAERVQRSARQAVDAWDAPPYAVDALQPNPTELDLLREGVRYRVVYDRATVIDQPGRLAQVQADIQDGEQARVTDVPMKLVLSDHPMAFVPMAARASEHGAGLLIHDPTVCAALLALFELYWESAVPLATFRREATELPTGEPSPAERALLALLLSGFTDAQMAVHLGWSERTVGHRLRSLRTRLDAHTRFQAGYQAVLRGWLTPEGGLRDG